MIYRVSYYAGRSQNFYDSPIICHLSSVIKPAARVIWDFFRHFSRDMKTKKLMYTE